MKELPKKLRKRRKGESPILTDDDIRVTIARIRDAALQDWQYAVICDGHKDAKKYYNTLRSAMDELARLLDMTQEQMKKVEGKILLKFMPSEDD